LRGTVIPTGVDIHYYTPSDGKPENGSNIVFVGHFKHYPNVDAVQYFMKDIWSLVLESVPEARFFIVGSGAGEAIKKYSASNVVVAEDVEDVRVYLHKASVFVAPVRLGGGIKGKVLEAMACGVPVVGTPDVCAGFINDPGNDILKASDERDFADKVIHILQNPSEGARLAENARKLVENSYNWDNIARQLSSFYESFIDRKARKI
jgi:glycosyltransferase involved in cell wall biosynthesis